MRSSSEFDAQPTPAPDDPGSAYAWQRNRDRIEAVGERLDGLALELAGFQSGVAGIMSRVDDLQAAHAKTAREVAEFKELGLPRRVDAIEGGMKILHKLDKDSAVQTKMLEHLTIAKSDETSRFRFAAGYIMPALALIASIVFAVLNHYSR